MFITIDSAGRVVIPKSIRDRFHLEAGTSLEVRTHENRIQLIVPTGETKLREKSGVLVFDSGDQSDLDLAAFISQQRHERSTRG